MSEFIYHIHYRPGFKVGKPDGLSRRIEEEKSAMHAHLFDEGQLLDLENDEVEEQEDAKDVELEGIEVAKWEKKNRLCVVLPERRLAMLHQHHDSQVAGH